MGFAENYTEGSNRSGARFFRARDFVGSAAILIEVNDFKADVPRKQERPSDKATENQAFCDVTVWSEPADLDVPGAETEYLNVKINQTILAADLAEQTGKVLVKTINALPSSALVWRQVEPDVVKKVGAYFDAREAKRKAVAEAIDSAGDEQPAWMRGE